VSPAEVAGVAKHATATPLESSFAGIRSPNNARQAHERLDIQTELLDDNIVRTVPRRLTSSRPTVQRVIGFHLPFPGIGIVERCGSTCRILPA
jgi:hypothetical protein